MTTAEAVSPVNALGGLPYPVDYGGLAAFVVVRELAGLGYQLEVVRDVARGLSPSMAAFMHGVGKSSVAALVNRVRERALGRFWRLKFLRVLEAAEDVGIRPVVAWSGGGCRCFCGKAFSGPAACINHIYRRHPDIVALYTQAVLKGVFGR